MPTLYVNRQSHPIEVLRHGSVRSQVRYTGAATTVIGGIRRAPGDEFLAHNTYIRSSDMSQEDHS